MFAPVSFTLCGISLSIFLFASSAEAEIVAKANNNAAVAANSRGATKSRTAARRIVVGQNTVYTYHPTCVKLGFNINDSVTFTVSGQPTTGGATAKFVPNPVATFNDTKLTVSTTENTKPGKYVMTVVGTGPKCGSYGTDSLPLEVAPKIKGNKVVWWFDGQDPTGYKTKITLEAFGPGAASYDWTIPTGGGKAKVASKVANTADIVGIKGSTAADDVIVRVSAGGVLSNDFKLTVKAPRELDFLRNVHKPSATWGYETEVHYSIKDQFGRILPSSVPLNEHWTSAVTKDVATTNWRRGANGGAVVNPADWLDQIQGENTGGSRTPTPLPPQSPLGTRKIYHWDGEWSVGSTDPSGGKGVRVSKNTWQKFRDHALHTNFVSPAP